MSSPANNSISIDVNARMEKKILQDRIRELEDALEIEYVARRRFQHAQDSNSSESDPRGWSSRDKVERVLSERLLDKSHPVHPLLAPDKLSIKEGASSTPVENVPLSDPLVQEKCNPDDASQAEIVSAFGTLSITDGRTMRFLGASATEVSYLCV